MKDRTEKIQDKNTQAGIRIEDGMNDKNITFVLQAQSRFSARSQARRAVTGVAKEAGQGRRRLKKRIKMEEAPDQVQARPEAHMLI